MSLPGHGYPILRSRKRGLKTHWTFEFVTRTLPCFNDLYTLLHRSGVKVIPHNIYEILTPIALAHMIMADGSVQRHGLIICTNSYSVQDVVRLINVLIIQYRLKCSLRLKKRQNNKIEYLIYIRQSSMSLLRTIVTPYFHSSMLYKISK